MDPQVAFILAQCISVGTGIMAIALMQFKNMKLILLFQVLVNLLASTNYLLLDGGSGAIVSLLAVACSIVMFFYNSKQMRPHLAVAIAFMIAFTGCSVYNIIATSDFFEVLPAFAAFCFVMSLIQSKPSLFRIWGALNPLFWLPYDIHTKSYVMFAVHFGIFVSSVVGMIRVDGYFKKKDNTHSSSDVQS